MRFSDSSSQPSHSSHERERLSVSRLVNELVLSLGEDFAQGNITVELDVQPLEAIADMELIRKALHGLVGIALGSMPRGGELSVTLIDSPHQWELEVADTSNNRFVETAIEKSQIGQPESKPLPQDRPAGQQVHQDLRAVEQAAAAHGGLVQSWNCPQGGTANVLVIPKAHRNAA